MTIQVHVRILRRARDEISPNPRRAAKRNGLQECDQRSGPKNRGTKANWPEKV